MKTFSAVSYYFARSLHEQRGGPVGVIGACWGGSMAEAWTSAEAIAAESRLGAIPKRHDREMLAYPAKLADYQAAVAAGKGPKEPPRDPATSHQSPSRLYQGMIHPLIPVALRGCIWYQGEANKLRPRQYEVLLPAMIRDWRARWGREDLPFFQVQIAPFKGMTPEIREAQMRIATTVPGTDLAATLDVGEAEDIHPKNKRPVGERLALLARRQVYGEAVADSGPRYQGLTVAGPVVTVRFTRTDGGLTVRGEALTGFVIAGSDRVFVPARAVIRGDTVEVSAPGVIDPVAVRYAWEPCPGVSLGNGAGLPAFPFRSDDWPTGIKD